MSPAGGAAAGADLQEIAEGSATGETARIYSEIRTAVGMPMVNLIYRTLAAEPGRLEAVWAQLGPNLSHPAIDAAAAELIAIGQTVEQRSLPAPVIAAVGVADGGTDALVETIDAYQHANPRNLVALSALIVGAPGTPGGAAPSARVEARSFTTLPMAKLDELPAETRALLDAMSAPLIAPGEAALVPSLLRHFAHNPALLALLWTATAPAAEQPAFRQAASAVESRARELARELPYEVTRLATGETRDLVVRFATTISRMVVYAGLLRRALGR